MKMIINKILHNNFFQSISTLISGSLIAQVITIVASVLLARIYSPNELGIYTLILTAESLFGSVICLRYDIAIVSEKTENKVFSLVKLSFYITLALSLLLSVIYWKVYIWNDIDYHKYSYMLFLLIIMMFLRGVLNVLEAYNNRHGEYLLMTNTYVWRTVVQNGGAIVLGVLNFGVFGIVLAHTVGNLFGMKMQAKKLLENKNEITKVSSKEMWVTAKDNYKQPVYSSPAIFANRYSYSSISLFISQLFGARILGYYSISYKALGLPLSVVSNNVSKVFYKEASNEYSQNGEFKRTFVRTSSVLILFSIPLGVIVYLFTPLIFDIVLGSNWAQSAQFVRILIPMFCVRLVVNTIATGLQIVSKQDIELIIQLTLVAASVLIYFYVAYYNLSIVIYLKLINISFSIIYALYYLMVLKYAFGIKSLITLFREYVR